VCFHVQVYDCLSSECGTLSNSFMYSARAGHRRFWPLSALRAHTKAPYKTDLIWKTLRPLERPGRARTGQGVHRAGARRGLLLGERGHGLGLGGPGAPEHSQPSLVGGVEAVWWH
jgi:hypothetical protein